jgi:hypothetical protein
VSDETEDTTLETRGLDQLIKAFKTNLSRARVGILGAKTTRNDVKTTGGKSVNARGGRVKTKFEISTNAAVGALHEFGTDKMPMRSFLRMPISDQLQKRMEASGSFDKEKLRQVIKQGTMETWLKEIAVIAEGIVSDAFETGGFGKWAAWKTPGYKNQANQLLVDTQQLRDSITSEVK